MVMPALVAGIHVFDPGHKDGARTSRAMTNSCSI